MQHVQCKNVKKSCGTSRLLYTCASRPLFMTESVLMTDDILMILLDLYLSTLFAMVLFVFVMRNGQ